MKEGLKSVENGEGVSGDDTAAASKAFKAGFAAAGGTENKANETPRSQSSQPDDGIADD